MKIFALCFVAISLGSFAAAQDDHSLKREPKQDLQTREELIWDQVDTRLYRQADIWYEEGDFPRCVAALKYCAELHPDDEQTWSDYGWMLENIQENDAAGLVYKRFRLSNPGYVDAPYLEAEFYFRFKKYDKVPPLLANALKPKTHPNGYRILAHSYEKTGQLEKSRSVWQQYLKVAPNDGAAKHNLARVEQKIKDKKP